MVDSDRAAVVMAVAIGQRAKVIHLRGDSAIGRGAAVDDRALPVAESDLSTVEERVSVADGVMAVDATGAGAVVMLCPVVDNGASVAARGGSAPDGVGSANVGGGPAKIGGDTPDDSVNAPVITPMQDGGAPLI